jgi:hypothetical protein
VSASLPGLSGPDIQHEHETTLIGYEASTEGEQKSKKAKKSKKKKSRQAENTAARKTF